MNDIIKNTFEAIASAKAGQCLDKVTSRRNYVIVIKENCATLCPLGEARRRRLLRDFYLWEIAKYGITWAFFSKMADANEALLALEKCGYQIKKI